MGPIGGRLRSGRGTTNYSTGVLAEKMTFIVARGDTARRVTKRNTGSNPYDRKREPVGKYRPDTRRKETAKSKNYEMGQ